MNKKYISITFCLMAIIIIGVWLNLPNSIFLKNIANINLENENFNGVQVNNP